MRSINTKLPSANGWRAAVVEVFNGFPSETQSVSRWKLTAVVLFALTAGPLVWLSIIAIPVVALNGALGLDLLEEKGPGGCFTFYSGEWSKVVCDPTWAELKVEQERSRRYVLAHATPEELQQIRGVSQ